MCTMLTTSLLAFTVTCSSRPLISNRCSGRADWWADLDGRTTMPSLRAARTQNWQVAFICWHETRHEVVHLVVGQASASFSTHRLLCLQSPAEDIVDVVRHQHHPGIALQMHCGVCAQIVVDLPLRRAALEGHIILRLEAQHPPFQQNDICCCEVLAQSAAAGNAHLLSVLTSVHLQPAVQGRAVTSAVVKRLVELRDPLSCAIAKLRQRLLQQGQVVGPCCGISRQRSRPREAGEGGAPFPRYCKQRLLWWRKDSASCSAAVR